MLVFLKHELVFLATPKTGTTAIETALRPHAEIVFKKSRKHINAARYRNKVAPFLDDTFDARPATVAVMRDPLDQLASWYRYRSQDRLDGAPQSTKCISFDKFIRDALADPVPKHAQVGRQFRFLTNGQGMLAVDHLFAYERLDKFIAFFSARLGVPLTLPSQNVSPEMETYLQPDTEDMLRRKRQEDFALHQRLMEAGGHISL